MFGVSTRRRVVDVDWFHCVDEVMTPPRKTPGKKDGDNYKKRFKELQKHARELVRRHAALEAELAELKSQKAAADDELEGVRAQLKGGKKADLKAVLNYRSGADPKATATNLASSEEARIVARCSHCAAGFPHTPSLCRPRVPGS